MSDSQSLFYKQKISRLSICFFLFVPMFVILSNFVFTNGCFAGENAAGSPENVNIIKGNGGHTGYDIFLEMPKEGFEAGKDSFINLSVCYSSSYGRGKSAGDPVKNLQKVYDRIMEVFIVSVDFDHFAHTRPEDFRIITKEVKRSGSFMIKHVFPFAGFYRLVASVSHRGQMVYKHFNIVIKGKPKTAAKEQKIYMSKSDASGSFDDHNVTLNIKPFPIVEKRKIELNYYLKNDKGKDVDDLEIFMGSEMHFIAFSEDMRHFGYSKPKPPKSKPGTILIAPAMKTEMCYGTGILREISREGKLLIEHGKVKGLLPAGKYPFKINDPEALEKVEVGDWVEFWVVNKPDTSIAITRIEPLATVPSGDEKGIYDWAGNLALYGGPVIPVEFVFPAKGNYAVFSQFMRAGKVVTTRFFVNVKSVGALQTVTGVGAQKDDDKGFVKLSPQEQNGRMIYRKSKSLSGAPIYIKQDDGSKIVASETGITCVGCHGEDGSGGQEGGVLTSDIRYVYLTKPYGVTHLSGRKHPPYNDELLMRGITEGLDPAGNKLDPTMVRWEMSDTDLNDLVLYIHRLSEMGKPGVTDKVVRVGCVLDLSGPLHDTGMAVKEMIEAVFEKINNSGKIYGRSLKLVTADGGNDPSKSYRAAKHLVENENILCFLGNLGEAALREVVPYIEENGIPLLAPMAPSYQSGATLTRNVFYLFPSIEYQTRVLVDHVVRSKIGKAGKPTVAAFYSKDQFGQSGLKAAKDQLALYGAKLTGEIGYEFQSLDVAKVASSLAEIKADDVLVITPDARIMSIVAEADRLGYSPRYLCNNMLIMQNILKIPKAGERFLLTQNFSFAGNENPMCAEFLELIRTVPSRPKNVMLQIASFVGVKLLEEGLRLAGRDLTRKAFVSGLEQVEMSTGMLGVVAYKPGKHEGVSGIFLVAPDEGVGNFVPVTKWLRPTERDGLF